MKSQLHSYLIMLGHICTDINQGALPAMLPFLILAHDLSYASAAALVLASSMVSSVVQPFFGYMGDRLDRPWFMSIGIVLAGTGIALLGFVENYWALFGCAMLSGVGVALFHPEGGKLANLIAGEKKGASVSNFSVGGNLGFAIGPVIATFSLSSLGIHGTALFLLPTLIMAAILLSQNSKYRRFGQQEAERRLKAGQDKKGDDWSGFGKITALNFLRSIVGSGLIIFIPLYCIGILGVAAEVAPLMLTMYSGCGAIATFVGGRIADKIGAKKMIVLSFIPLGPCLMLFILSGNIFVAAIFMILSSLALSSAYSPIITLGQSYLPDRLGLASGISLGVVVSVGGITSPIIGLAGDTWGLPIAMGILCIVAFLAIPVSLISARHKHS